MSSLDSDTKSPWKRTILGFSDLDNPVATSPILPTTLTMTNTGTGTTVPDVEVNGVKIKVNGTAKQRSTASLYPRSLRPKEPKDFLALKDRATAKILPVQFDVIPMDLSDDKMLSEYHSVASSLKEIKQHLTAFDMLDVFTIVTPDHDANKVMLPTITGKPVDLFEAYGSLTSAEVRASIKWYQSFPVEELQMDTNLIWSYELLRKNTSVALLSRIDDQLADVPAEEIGGPLLLWHILRDIYSDADTIVEMMVKRVKEFKLSDVPGEDVTTATGQLRAAISRIWIAKKQALPDNLVMDLLKVFQTSSVPEFNRQFESMEYLARGAALSNSLFAGSTANPISDNTKVAAFQVMATADLHYNQLVSRN
ncbi:MAG: hypothetical protein SGILL_006857, partial [Bacillariaceae sp.]